MLVPGLHTGGSSLGLCGSCEPQSPEVAREPVSVFALFQWVRDWAAFGQTLLWRDGSQSCPLSWLVLSSGVLCVCLRSLSVDSWTRVLSFSALLPEFERRSSPTPKLTCFTNCRTCGHSYSHEKAVRGDSLTIVPAGLHYSLAQFSPATLWSQTPTQKAMRPFSVSFAHASP